MICIDIKFHLPGFSSVLHVDITNKIKTKRNFCMIAMLLFPFPTPTSEVFTSAMLLWFIIGNGNCNIRLFSNRIRFVPSFIKMCQPISKWKWTHTHTQRGDVKVCFFHFRNVSRLSKVHRLKFVPEAESERLVSVSRTSYFVLW